MFDFILQKHAFKKQLMTTNQWHHFVLSSDDYSILWYNKLNNISRRNQGLYTKIEMFMLTATRLNVMIKIINELAAHMCMYI